jgi:hypothetical protein
MNPDAKRYERPLDQYSQVSLRKLFTRSIARPKSLFESGTEEEKRLTNIHQHQVSEEPKNITQPRRWQAGINT